MRDAKLPPGPRSPKLVQTLAWQTRPIAFFKKCRAKYGPRFTLNVAVPPKQVILSDPNDIAEFFNAPPGVLRPGEGASGITGPVVGTNFIVVLDQDEHMTRRKLLTPYFHGDSIKRLAALVNEVVAREVDQWPRNQPIQLYPKLRELTLEIIVRAVFGLERGPQLEELKKRLIAFYELGGSPFTVLEPFRRELGGITPWARFLRRRAEADELIHQLIDERRASGRAGDDVLAMLLTLRNEDGSEWTHQELRDELVGLFTAGHETLASEMSWMFVKMAREPRVVANIVDEIRRGDGHEYLTATVQEILRWRPVLSTSAPRLVKEPITIGGWTYPPGVGLLASAYLVHHDPNIYPDPYEFRPERFLESPPGVYTWLPWGGGRRRCLGARFAMLELETVLRTVLERCELTPGVSGPEVARRQNIAITPAAGALTVLRDRPRIAESPIAEAIPA
jgi:cytochrome P450